MDPTQSQLEQAVMDQQAHQSVDPSPLVEVIEPEPEPAAPETPTGELALPPSGYLSKDAFIEQWFLMHEFAGGVMQTGIGQPVPLGDAARSEGGRMAGEAAYELISSNPALAKLILSPESTFLAQLAMIGLHGIQCVQIVKASARAAVEVKK